MIRFCDGEVDCVEYNSLTRLEMLNYFLPDHKNNILCVCDDFHSGRYIGMVTYKSFQQSINVDGAIQKVYVVWDNDLWQNAREYFKYFAGGGVELLPVLNRKYQLMCFAYDDEDANREIRMLQELQEFSDTLQFTDIYPEIKCVKICEFNELAYYFALYLNGIGITVVTEGALWQEWFCGEDCLFPDYECFSIYAEGIEGKKHDWKEELPQSVSVEFECIDRIYEANILESKIEDAAGDYTWLVEQLKNKKEIVIIGTGIESINAYDFLVSQGIDILCFLSENREKWENKIFGRRVLSESKIKNTLVSPVFLECHAKNSAWGFGGVDRYDYEGYRRNKQYILLKDYIDIDISCLSNILKGKNVILVGNLNLCYSVEHILSEIENCNVSYWDILDENPEKNLNCTDSEDVEEDDICFLIEPQYVCYNRKLEQKIVEKSRMYWEKLKERNIVNVIDYFSKRQVLISIHKKDVEKYTLSCLTPGKILLNVSGHMSGNDFFQFILDGHPDIMMIDDAVIRSNLFFICMQLAEEKSENILNAFWKIYSVVYQDAIIVKKRDLFNEKFRELLSYKDQFTSQELFVMFHIVYTEMWGQTGISDIHNMLIYYEDRAEFSHERRMDYEEWLRDEKIKGYSITIIRNAYARLGSFFKHLETYCELSYSTVGSLWRYMTYENESKNPPAYWKRIGIKFETLKIAPKETLMRLCDELEIPWVDCLLKTTRRGDIAEYLSGNGVIVGFDLKPVYNLYEEYFSDFDRFRVNMIFSNIQRIFGYPYVSSKSFSMRQLQEMFLKKFRFEDRLSNVTDDCRMRYHKDFVYKVHIYLQKAHREEVMYDMETDSLWEGIRIL